MSELTLIHIQYYKTADGMYYLVRGDQLVQFDKNYCLQIMPGTEVHYHLMRKLKKSTPIAGSEGDEIFTQLKTYLKKLTEIDL